MPTNQSGLGPIIDSRVTSGWSLVTSIGKVALPVPPKVTLWLMISTAWGEASSSDRNLLVMPVSATSSTPGEARPPLCQKVTSSLWTAPMRVVKCAFETTPPGVLSRVQLPWNVTS